MMHGAHLEELQHGGRKPKETYLLPSFATKA